MAGHRVVRRLAVALILTMASAAGGAIAQTYQPFRYDDDFRYLRQPHHRVDFFDPIKDIRLGGDAWLSIGGELRERVESVVNPGFGLRGGAGDTYGLHRALLHADLHVGDVFRLFVQLGFQEQSGRDPVTSTDVNRFDLAQGFIDITLPVLAGQGPTMRAGRQEVGLGSQRLVSARDGTNIRRAFDGFRVFERFGDTRVDLFALWPVLAKDGTFDDRPDGRQALWGVYVTTPVPVVPSLKADLYYLGFRNERGQFGGITGEEIRHSFGLRLFGAASGFDWNLEGTLQVGGFANQDIFAGSLAADIGFTLADLPWKPRLGLKANYASGDSARGDGRLGTFNPLYPRLPYFSEATLIAPANLIDIFPSLRIEPLPGVSLSIGWDFLWRASRQDAVYGSPFTAYPRTAQSRGRQIGHQLVVEAQWRINAHLTLSGSYVHFTAGDALREAGGRDVDFFMTALTARF